MLSDVTSLLRTITDAAPSTPGMPWRSLGACKACGPGQSLWVLCSPCGPCNPCDPRGPIGPRGPRARTEAGKRPFAFSGTSCPGLGVREALMRRE